MRLLPCLTAATVLWLVPLPGLAATAVPDMSDVISQCGAKFDLCRYINKRTKQEVIPARFERALPFSEGLAAVRIGGRFGYIDHRGEIVIRPTFDLAGQFYQGLAEVLVGDKAGIINRAGVLVVEPMFRRAVPSTSNVVIVSEGPWTSGYYPGHEVLPGLKGEIFSRGKYGLYHIAGHWVRRPDLTQVMQFEQDGRGLIWATDKESSTGPFGLLASDGKWIVEPQYEYAGALSDERAVVRKRVDGALLTGAVDPTGQLVVPLQPWALSGWRNGWSLVRESYQGGKEGLVDKSGRLVGGRYFDKVDRWDEGDVAAVLVDGRWMGLDRAGNIVPYPRNGRVFASCPNGIRVVELDGKMQIIDAGGQQTAPYLFDLAWQQPPCDRPFVVRLNGKWGFVGLDGRLLVDPPMFDDLQGFEGAYAFVQRGGKWGVIDVTGRVVVQPKFDNVLARRAGLIQVTIGGRKVWVTATGEERPEPPVDNTPPPGMLECGHGLKLIERDGRWGIGDADGRDVVAPRYRAITCFSNGVAFAAVDDRREWCPLGPDGVLHDKPVCRTVQFPYLMSHHYPEKLHDDPFESSVLWTRAYLEFGAGKRNAPPCMIGDGVRGHGSTCIGR